MQTAIGILLLITGIGIIGFWSLHVARGGLAGGLRTLENGGYICFHIFTELLTGFLCVVGSIAVFCSLSWGVPLTLAASGMLLYAGVNSLAWSEVKNNRIFAGIFGTAAVIALLAIIYYVFVY